MEEKKEEIKEEKSIFEEEIKENENPQALNTSNEEL